MNQKSPGLSNGCLALIAFLVIPPCLLGGGCFMAVVSSVRNGPALETKHEPTIDHSEAKQ